MENEYAQALWETIQKGKVPHEAVRALHAYLLEKGRVALMPRIALAFRRIAERERARSGTTLSVARATDEHAALRETKDLLSEMDVSQGDVEVRVDESLVGGWRLEGRETLVDASFKKNLLDMYNRATAA